MLRPPIQEYLGSPGCRDEVNSPRGFCGSLAASRWDEVLVRGPQGQIKSSYPASFSPGSAILKQVGVVLIYVCV